MFRCFLKVYSNCTSNVKNLWPKLRFSREYDWPFSGKGKKPRARQLAGRPWVSKLGFFDPDKNFISNPEVRAGTRPKFQVQHGFLPSPEDDPLRRVDFVKYSKLKQRIYTYGLFIQLFHFYRLKELSVIP